MDYVRIAVPIIAGKLLFAAAVGASIVLFSLPFQRLKKKYEEQDKNAERID